MRKSSAQWLSNKLKNAKEVGNEAKRFLDTLYQTLNPHFPEQHQNYTNEFLEEQWVLEKQYHRTANVTLKNSQLQLGGLLCLQDKLDAAWGTTALTPQQALARATACSTLTEQIRTVRERLGTYYLTDRMTQEESELLVKVWHTKTEVRRRFLALIEEKQPLIRVRRAGETTTLGTWGQQKLIESLRKHAEKIRSVLNSYNNHVRAYVSAFRFPHLQNSTSPTQAAPCKGKGTSPDEYEPRGLNLTAYGIQALNLSIDLCSVLSGLLCPLPTYNFTDPSQYSIPAIPALAWAVTWLSASFLILAALIALAAVTIAPSSFLLTAPPCEPCGKSFNTLVAQNNHLVIKKHHQTINQQPKENKHQQTKIGHLAESSSNPIAQLDSLNLSEKIKVDAIPSEQKKADLERLIELQIAQAPRIEPNECLFCPRSSSVRFADPDQALTHMLRPHGFFLPDQEYLVNRPSLLAYLAETIAVWNVCLYCGTGFGGKITADQALPDHASLTRKGLESNHCKLAWDTEEQRLEYSDFFDY
ncbi:hypothetical protein PtA15_3A747 [Puccinia triticina]|uniref:C2H2-type domain-containing protein n=1 Tax=Puccinia triticina TaxID=208348 RepID=A0ABY7CFW6_9BASI|nr:uncharacterized protein PtA15_3A747 [Puccinia triticina]WAQ83377.1 hypothetical protein PtA15_3A747 [Puccinia triticina]